MSRLQRRMMTSRSRRLVGNKVLPAARRGIPAFVLRPILEALEDRVCLSVFYDFDIMARTGQDGVGASIQPSVSINDSGNVAFVAASGSNQNVFVSTGPGSVTGIASAASNRTYGGEVQINNSNQVAAVAISSGATVARNARIYTLASPGAFTNVGVASAPRADSSNFDSIGAFASMTNDGQLAFAGLESPTSSPSFWEVNLSKKEVDRRDAFNLPDIPQVVEITLPPSAFFRMMAADGDRAVVGNRQGTKTDIIWYDITGVDTFKTIASTDSGWSQLGVRPGISDDGTVVTFFGNKGDGVGLYACVLQGTTLGIPNFSDPILIAGANGTKPRPELGYVGPATIKPSGSITANPIYFKSADFVLDSRAGVVTYQNSGGSPDSIEAGESFIVSFLGTPSQAGTLTTNTMTHAPPLFTDQAGLWTVQVTARTPLTGGTTVNFADRTSAIPVIQVGDKIDGQAVTSLGINDPLSKGGGAQGAPVGPLPIQRGDHQVAFTATTSSGTYVVRAIQSDADQDGLFDHWERDGIDIDNDDKIDLDLPRMGAQIFHKDMFLEMDWLAPDMAEPFTDTNGNGRYDPTEPFTDLNLDGYFNTGDYSPQSETLDALVTLFENAPFTNPDLVGGVTIHIDGGFGLNRNMSRLGGVPDPTDLQGGDLITEAVTGKHVHVVYMGPNGSFTPPSGAVDSFRRPIVARSMETIKPSFFGTTTKAARELTFRYAVLADQIVDLTGGTLGLAESPYIDLSIDQRSMPGNDFIIGLQGTRRTASGFLNVPFPGGAGPAPPPVMEPAGYRQAQTIAHEIGHTLRLLHGGVDMITTFPVGTPGHNPARYKPTYRSMMNYAFDLSPDPSGVLIRDYSRASDPVYDDWGNVELGFARYFDIVGNSFNITSRLEGAAAPPLVDQITLGDVEAQHGPSDAQPPHVGFDPPPPSSVSPGSTLVIRATAIDDIGVKSVAVEFDVDGNGVIDSATDRLIATLISPGVYQASFVGITGPGGNRSITVTAEDAAGFSDRLSRAIQVLVSSGNQAPVLAPVGGKTINELNPLSFTATATDPDLPANTLTFSLIGAPTGAGINASSGLFSWTPTEAQGPGAFTFKVRVTDDGSPAMFDEEEITVTVNEVNTAPILSPIGNKAVDEQAALSFTIAATDADLPANTLSYSASGLPSGATFDPVTRNFSWTPTEAQDGAHDVTFTVNDGGVSASEIVRITVFEVNTAPVLAPIGSKTVDEQTALSFTIGATDADLPANTLVYSASGLPGGATFDPVTRTFSWTPTEAQGPGPYLVTFRVGDGSLAASETITVTVNEVNTAPVLAAIGNKTIAEGALLGFTASASDADLPANGLTFSLAAGVGPGATPVPAGASINPATGAFTWTPTPAQGPGSYTFKVMVTDNGLPALSDEEQITITVVENVTVDRLVINDGDPQRSMVTSQTILFSGLVNIDTGAFELRKLSGGTVGLNVAVSDVAGKTQVVLTYLGSDIIGGSLADGFYSLVVHGDLVHDRVTGADLDGDGDGTSGGDRVDAFFRMFGDADGDADVDNLDYFRMRAAVGRRTGDAGYRAYLDYNGDGIIDIATDVAQFNLRRGRRLIP